MDILLVHGREEEGGQLLNPSFQHVQNIFYSVRILPRITSFSKKYQVRKIGIPLRVVFLVGLIMFTYQRSVKTAK